MFSNLNFSTESIPEKRLRRAQEADALDNRFGFVRILDASEHFGWMVNMHAVS